MSDKRMTAQQHLDYWVEVLRSVGEIPGQGSEHQQRQHDLRKIAKSEVKRWSQIVRSEYRGRGRKRGTEAPPTPMR